MPKAKKKIKLFNFDFKNNPLTQETLDLYFKHRGEGLEDWLAEEYRNINYNVTDKKSFDAYLKKMKMSYKDAYTIISELLRTNRKEWLRRVVAKGVVDDKEEINRFMESIKKYKTRKVFERTDPDNAMKHLEVNTLYKAPNKYKTFEQDIRELKSILGIKKRVYDGSYTRKTLAEAEARLKRKQSKIPK